MFTRERTSVVLHIHTNVQKRNAEIYPLKYFINISFISNNIQTRFLFFGLMRTNDKSILLFKKYSIRYVYTWYISAVLIKSFGYILFYNNNNICLLSNMLLDVPTYIINQSIHEWPVSGCKNVTIHRFFSNTTIFFSRHSLVTRIAVDLFRKRQLLLLLKSKPRWTMTPSWDWFP